MRNQIDLRRMRYVVEVARAGSITVAAETLRLTQPAVTRGIAEVEADLGLQLFQRVPRGVRLTEAGERFVEYARRILADVDDLVGAMRDGAETVSGRLRIGAAPSTDAQFILRSVKVLAREFPAVKLEIIPGSAEALCPRLLAGELHGIIGASVYLERWRELQVRHLRAFTPGCMVRKGHPITLHPNPTELDMLRYPVLVPASVESNQSVLALRYQQHGLHMQPQYVTDHPLLIRALISASDAFHVVHHTDPTFRALRADFDVMTGLLDLPRRDLCLATSLHHPPTAALTRFERILIEDFLGPAPRPENPA